MKFDKQNNKVIIALMADIMKYPPTLNLVRLLLDNGYRVCLIAQSRGELQPEIIESPLFVFKKINAPSGFNIADRIKRRIFSGGQIKKIVSANYASGDIVWVATDMTARVIGSDLNKYKFVLQILELEEKCQLFKGSKWLTFPIKKYAQKAYKVVVPEINRAYIQKIWWNLSETPVVLPNKPYTISYGKLDTNTKELIEKLRQEKRKKIIYLGVIDKDRDFSVMMDVVEDFKDEFCFYIFGSVYDDLKDSFDALLKKHPNTKYMGFVNPPQHLALLENADIGLLPYYINSCEPCDYQLNTLYCAPNKIFEYAGYELPMIGSELLGLQTPFEKYNIGVCCDMMNKESIVAAINKLSVEHDEMKKNCKDFFDSVDLVNIIEKIIN